MMKPYIYWIGLLAACSNVLGIQDYCNRGYNPKPGANFELDLSKLDREFDLYHNKTTPPTTSSTKITVNICNALKRPDNVEEQDFCQSGAYVCRRVINVKNNDERVIEVQDIAGDFEKSKLNAEFKLPDNVDDLSKSGVRYSLILKGGRADDRDQSAHITLECDEGQKREDDAPTPELLSYENGVLSLHWKTVFACAAKPGESLPPPSGDQGNQSGMSALGIFFTILWVLALVYFVAGAFYNFKVYNARGLDLIPHRDFWLDLPYLIKDLISHVADSIFSRQRGSSGYVAV